MTNGELNSRKFKFGKENGQLQSVLARAAGQSYNPGICAPVAPRSVDATFCLNQCHMRGECAKGVCQCEAGYGGVDCSIDLERAALAAAAGGGGGGQHDGG